MKFKRSIYNIIFGLISQIVIITLAIVIPRMFIIEYGSEVNGLFSTIGQLFVYVALLEAGVGAATVQALYRPIAFNDRQSISSTLSATKSYFKKISIYYTICVIILSVVYPLIVNSTINKVDIGIIVFLYGISGSISFYFQATLKQLLLAEGRNYVTSNITLIIQVIISATKITLILLSANIVLIQFSYFIITLIQLLIYHIYFKKNYKWVDFNATPDFTSLRQKNSFLIHQISSLVFSSTDILIISIFCSLKVASVYAVYNLIIVSLNSLIGAIQNSTTFVLGLTYHENKQKYLELHDAYENYYITFVFAIMSICYVMFTPFIKLYTKGIVDINYVDKYLPFLFCVIQLLTCSRVVSNNLIRIAGHMKQTIPRSLLESMINLSISLVLVRIIGIYGVLIGTIIALLYRANDIIIYTNIKILKRMPFKTYKTILINTILFVIVVYCNKIINIDISSYKEFVKYGLLISLLLTPIYFVIGSITNTQAYTYLKGIIKLKIRPKSQSSNL